MPTGTQGIAEASRRARLTVWSLWASLVATALVLAAAVVYLVSIADLPASKRIYDPADPTALFVLGAPQIVFYIAFLLLLVVALAQAVLGLRWFYRAYANIGELGLGEQRYAKAQAVWTWFVPILNLFRPKQLVNDVWRAGLSPGGAATSDAGGRTAVPALLNWWWATVVLASLVSFLPPYSIETVGDERATLVILIVSFTLASVAFVSSVSVVKLLSRRQEEAAATGSSAGPGPSAAAP